MKCCHCKGNVASGAEARKMVVEYTQPDGTVKTFGYQMPDGPLTAATGQLRCGWHHKCFHVVRKREMRGDAVTGRVVLDAGGTLLTDKLAALRDIAAQVGKAIGDPYVSEAYQRQVRGPNYPHSHNFRMDGYQLHAHLLFGHDHSFCGVAEAADERHQHLHAEMNLRAAQAQREQDPSHTEPGDADWRTQVTTDI